VSQIFYCVYSTGRQAQKDGESSGFHPLSFFALLFLFLLTWTWRMNSWRSVRDFVCSFRRGDSWVSGCGPFRLYLRRSTRDLVSSVCRV
jgi:hypothetical protein